MRKAIHCNLSARLALVAALALVVGGLAGTPAATAAPIRSDHPDARPASALLNCPTGSGLYVPDRQSVATYGGTALIPANMPVVRNDAAANPALRELASPRIHWLSSVRCGHSDHVNGPDNRPGSPNPGRFAQTNVRPLDTPTQRYCSVTPGVDCLANWSGYESGPNAPSGMKTTADMEWNVPTQASSDDNNDVITVWPGFGQGTNADYLVQAGTESDQTTSFGGIIKDHSYTAWYEIVPGESEVPIDNLPIDPGDHMNVIVFYDTSSHLGNFILVDETTDQGVDLTQRVPGRTGSQSEWVVERSCTGDPCTFHQLGNFGTEHISYAGGAVTNGNTSSPFSLTPNGAVPGADPQQIPMTDCKETQFLAWPDYPSASDQGFDDIWQNYGAEESC